MNDIEKLLNKSGSAKPRQALRADFTQSITNYIASRPRKKGLAYIKELFTMKLFAKPALAVAAIVMVIAVLSGTAYATVAGWPGVIAIFDGQHDLPGGDRVVQVDTKNCKFITAFNVADPNKKEEKVYYRVKEGSKLTNEQVVQIVQGNCFVQEQADFDMQVVQTALNSNPLNKDRVVGGYVDSLVIAISDTSISLESTWPIGSELKTIQQTFNHIAPDVLVYQSPNRLTLRDIKVGDHVSISYRASGNALLKSESISPADINPDEQVVVMINKNSPDLTAAINYQKYNGSEFEQVVPCDTQPSRYCTLGELKEVGREVR